MRKWGKRVFFMLISALTGAVIGAGAAGKVTVEKTEKAQTLSDKHLSLFLMMNQWVKVKQEGRSLATYFEKNQYKKIAVYGMSYVGKTLLNELKDTGITVAYGIDKKVDAIYTDVEIISVEEPMEDVDAVVVTAITFFDEIEEKLAGKLDCPVISLEDILYEM